MSAQTPLQEALSLLSDPRSPKRRAGAKRLRKIKDPSAGPALLQQLQREVQDVRTWETQYQLVMALGECDYRPALPYLQALASTHFEATMVYVALGDALVRLGRTDEHDALPIVSLLDSGNDMLIDGAFRAMAMLHMQLAPDAIRAILLFVEPRDAHDGLRFWIAAAAAGWEGPEVAHFLRQCQDSPRDDVKRAATASQQKRYLQWSPL